MNALTKFARDESGLETVEYAIMAAYAEGLEVLRAANAGKHAREVDEPQRAALCAPAVGLVLDPSRKLPQVARGGEDLAQRGCRSIGESFRLGSVGRIERAHHVRLGGHGSVARAAGCG